MLMSSAKVCFGGTFDPIHAGHIGSAIALSKALPAQVTLLPNGQPAHRATPGASSMQRLAMLQLACEANPELLIDSRELDRTGLSYTVDTVKSMRAEIGPQETLIWCLGMDAFAQLHTWHKWRELLQYTHLLVMERPASELPQDATLIEFWQQHQVAELGQLLTSPSGSIASVCLPQFAISATAIRQLLEQGKTPSVNTLPAKVAQYITAENLYKVETN
jgi:nicotinate-nucleotide adenylyltransferase